MPQPKLNPKQKRFAQEYIVDFNATDAAKRAGYSERTAGSQAHDLLKKPEILTAIHAAMQKRDKRVEISQDRILLELSRIAFGDLRDILTWNGRIITLTDSKELSADSAAALAEVAETAAGALKVKRHDKVKALELLMRHKGMLNDKLALNIPPDSLGVATCEQKSLAARERLLSLRAEREARASETVENHSEVPHE